MMYTSNMCQEDLHGTSRRAGSIRHPIHTVAVAAEKTYPSWLPVEGCQYGQVPVPTETGQSFAGARTPYNQLYGA